MIVAVAAVGMMQVSTDEIINVIPVGHTFMSTVRTVGVPVIVPFAVMIRRARTWIDIADPHEMFIDMVAMNMMQVAIVQIVGVAIVLNSHMSALGAVGVFVGSMLLACGIHGN